MDSLTPDTLKKAIAAHPQASLQDALLMFCVMLVALILALQYDLFFFVERLDSPESRISLAEAIFLTVLLGICLSVFVVRRMSERRKDVASKAAAEVELSELTALVMQDPLTGLFNRRALLKALEDATASPPMNETQHALFMIDLNHFKQVNDDYGHAVGDEVLEALAGRFKAAARPSDVVARMGGDEFAILAYNIDHLIACDLAARFLETLESAIRAGGHNHKIGMAIGVALIPQDGATAEEVLRNADLAMYAAKAQGTPLMFFDPDMDQKQQIA